MLGGMASPWARTNRSILGQQHGGVERAEGLERAADRCRSSPLSSGFSTIFAETRSARSPTILLWRQYHHRLRGNVPPDFTSGNHSQEGGDRERQIDGTDPGNRLFAAQLSAVNSTAGQNTLHQLKSTTFNRNWRGSRSLTLRFTINKSPPRHSVLRCCLGTNGLFWLSAQCVQCPL